MKVLGVEVPPASAEREPVLDIPAVDMTDVASAPSKSSVESGKADTQKHRRPASKGSAQRRVASRSKSSGKRTADAAEAPKNRRDGSVGRQTVEAVETLVAQGKSKADAFKQVAKDTGRSAGTVATTYYRLAGKPAGTRGRRKSSTASPMWSARQVRSTRGGRSSTGNDADVQRLADQLVRSVSELASAFKAQSEEVAELRRRVEGVRDLVG